MQFADGRMLLSNGHFRRSWVRLCLVYVVVNVASSGEVEASSSQGDVSAMHRSNKSTSVCVVQIKFTLLEKWVLIAMSTWSGEMSRPDCA